MTFFRGIDARPPLLQSGVLCVDQRSGVQVAEVRLFRLQNDVLDLLIVREVRGDQGLPRFLDDRRPPAEVEQQIRQRELWAEGRAVEDRAPALCRLPRAAIRSVEIDFGVVRRAAAADDRLRSLRFQPGGARCGIVLQCQVDRARHGEIAEVRRLAGREGGWEGGGGRGPRR